MRILFGIVVIVAMAFVGVWVWKARKAKGNTPALDAVTAWLGAGAQRDDGAVSGALQGHTLTYENKQYRRSMWTELVIQAPGAKILLDIHAPRDGDGPSLGGLGADYFVTGAPAADARTLVAALSSKISAVHPKSIEIEDTRVKLVADRAITDPADARAFVQLGLDLAARTTGGQAVTVPAAAADEQRQGHRDEQAANRTQRTIAAVLVFLAVGGGLALFGYKMVQRRNATINEPR